MRNPILQALVHFSVRQLIVGVMFGGDENWIPTEGCGALRMEGDFPGCSALEQGDLFTATIRGIWIRLEGYG